jgi:putative FmdB family regulatory protein
MPIYEYRCKSCRCTFEALQKPGAKPLQKCKKCGGAVEKLISSPAIQFKGNGWYITDYARKSSSDEAEAKPKAGSGKKEDSSRKDTKPPASSD